MDTQVLLFSGVNMMPYDGRVGPDEPVSTRRSLMTMTGSWSRWFAVGIVASTIAVGAPPHVSAQKPTPSVETPLTAKPEDKGPNTGRISLNFGVDFATA